MAEEGRSPVRWAHVMMIVSVIGILVLPTGVVVWQGGAISAKLDYAITQFARVEANVYTKDMARADIASQQGFYNSLDIRLRVVEEEHKRQREQRR